MLYLVGLEFHMPECLLLDSNQEEKMKKPGTEVILPGNQVEPR